MLNLTSKRLVRLGLWGTQTPAIVQPLHAMKLQFKVNDHTGKIIDAYFRTFVCGSSIASSSIVSTFCLHRSVRNVIGPLQFCSFQTDFVPRDPTAKSKRYKYPAFYDPYGPRPPPYDKIIHLAERIAALSTEERVQIGPALRERLRHPKIQPISVEDMDLGYHGGPTAGTTKDEEKKVVKTAFNVQLEKFEASAKIKVIKEVRAFASLGLKEAKDLVEKVSVLIKQGVTKEEANDIIEKIKVVGVAIMD